jgi:hypothetical protein
MDLSDQTQNSNLRYLRKQFHIPVKLQFPSHQLIFFLFLMMSIFVGDIFSQALNIPTQKAGLSIGNSKEFNGLRLNFRDKNVEQINGVNLTLWKSNQNKDAVVNGLSFGVVPMAGYLRGINLGIVGIGAEYEVRGITIGLLGAGSGDRLCGLGIGGLGLGSGGDMRGIFLGGLGVGSGADMTGIMLGGLGAGAGGNMTGLVFGGLGAGAGGDMTGISIGGLGAGAGGNISGISIALLGAGSGENISGISLAGLGAGAGRNMTGIVIAGLGAGCGEKLTGIAVGGLGAGAPLIEGLAIGGFAAGGYEVQGATVALGWTKINDNGYLKGFAFSAFNQIKGDLSGVSLGIVNYARHVNGIQFGIINYIKDNPAPFKILPLVNAHFD